MGTSDSKVISSPKPEAHNINTTNASAASRDDGSPATIPTTTPENRQLLPVGNMVLSGQLLVSS